MRELDIILLDLQPVITGMNKEQLSIGHDATGEYITPEYSSSFYATVKKNQLGSNAPLGTPDLKFSGDFYRGFKILIGATEVTITSTDIKTLQLEGKYGDIFGLEPESLAELSHRYVLPQLAIRIKKLFI